MTLSLCTRNTAHKTWPLACHYLAVQRLLTTQRCHFSSHEYVDNESGRNGRYLNKSKHHYVLRNVQERDVDDWMNKHTRHSIADSDDNDEESGAIDPIRQRHLSQQYEQTQLIAFDDCQSTDEIMHILWTSPVMLTDLVYEKALIQCNHLADFQGALRVFREMTTNGIAQSLHTYHVLLQCLCDCDRTELAAKHLNMMERNGVAPNIETFKIILSRCKQRISNLELAETLWKKMIFEHQIEPNIDICNAMIAIYAKCGEVHKAETIWKHLSAHNMANSQTCAEMIYCYAVKKDERRLVQMQRFMESNGIAMESEHYHGIIKYYLSTNQAYKVLKIFDEIDMKLVHITEPLLYQLCLTYLRLKKPDRVIRNLYDKYPRLFDDNQELYGLYFEAHLMELSGCGGRYGSSDDASGKIRELLMVFRKSLSDNLLTGFWTKYTDEDNPNLQTWWIDVHGVYRRKEMVRFVLRYIFQFEHRFLKEQLDLNQDIVVLCGRGAHSGIGVMGTAQTLVEHELLSWNPPIRCTVHSNYGECLVLNKEDVRRFFKRHGRSGTSDNSLGKPFFDYP
mmetsp:Transcript_52603/g.83784  ORF Transcript_52603/g.83784 Transcript_52603/m.83784 type:complete len:564 (+) Transcript_52603:64-1755(+)